MKISREEVLRVAELAHLELSEADVETYRGQLDSILEYVDKLNEVDLSGIEPMAQVLFSSGDANPSALREDVERPCNTGSELLKQAPDARKPYFRVPKVIDR
ncbi:MAG: Asp-tRNA(Asn)/Glu-tRNA(Gln) amidotransferase subunit GatC [Candidatus Acidiferrales bacterium]|jgi:aspartyl-tRNA(Asn)/glutamyl-tRNA(Gln) amidotransferase subunit C